MVISGDLTQRASATEYAGLKRFLEAEIEPLVNAGDDPVKPRIVIIPGNHDVDWSAEVFDTLALADAQIEKAKQWFADGQWRPETTPYRVKIGNLGHTSAFQIRGDRYHERFKSVQDFLDDYYAGSLTAPHRPFNLLDPRGNGSGDWQAHVFPDLHVALVGFNSCYRNDRYWHGAQIHETAITEARNHLDRLDRSRSFLRIGVWHHGLESHRTRPDRLTFENLTAIVTSGIKVGFHGHVHKSHAQLHRFIADDFALVSTGTLGAATDDRPDAVANQFSIVDLHRNRLRVDVYESEGLGAYGAREDRRRFMYFDQDLERPLDISKPVRSWASHVTRRASLDPETGVAKIDVEVDELDLSEPITLARVPVALCTAPESTAQVDGQLLPVAQSQIGSFIYFRSNGWVAKRYRRVTWSYRIANAFALTRAEPALKLKREDYPHLKDGSEVWSHRVQFDYDRLTLEFQLDAPDGAYFGSGGAAGGAPAITPIVERRISGGPVPWERLASEESRATKVVANARSCKVSWPSPMANARYGMTFPLANPGEPLPNSFAIAISRLVKLCRSSRALGDGLRKELATCLDASIKRALDLDMDSQSFSEHSVAVGNLWNASEHLLRPCFGFYPPDSWDTQFDAGRGIAGHAFRFARPAAWHRSIAGDYDVIRVPTTSGNRDYEWILCLPILTAPDSAAIGVFGFAGTRDHDTAAANQLAEFAQQIAQRDRAIDTSGFDDFWYVLNASFWWGLSEADKSLNLGIGVREMAEQCSTAFLTPSEDAEPPTLQEDPTTLRELPRDPRRGD